MTNQCGEALAEVYICRDAAVETGVALVRAGIEHSPHDDLLTFSCGREGVDMDERSFVQKEGTLEDADNMDMLLEEMKVGARSCRLDEVVAGGREHVGDVDGIRLKIVGEPNGSLVILSGVDNGVLVRRKAVVVNRLGSRRHVINSLPCWPLDTGWLGL